MKKILLYFISAFLLVSCSDEIPEHHQPARSGRTILAYLIANNNLDGNIMQNVKWMYESLSAAEDTCTLVVYYKPSSVNSYMKGPEILKFQSDGFGRINGQPILTGTNLTTENMLNQAERYYASSGISTNPDIMQENLQMMQEISPSWSYGLIFGSHASGWLPSPHASTFSFGQDGDSKNTIDIPELANTLEQSFDHKLDFVMFDACMMGTAEVFYELRKATQYCVASVMETPAVGFPYDRILTYLYDKEIDYTNLCNTIIEYNEENSLWGTYATVDCSQMEQVAQSVRNELLTHQSKLEQFDYSQVQQYGYIPSYTYFSFDVIDFIQQLNGGTVPSDIQESINEAVIAKSSMDCKNFMEIDPKRFCGMGMYFPDRKIRDAWDNYMISSIQWYYAAGWNEVH